MLKFIIFCVTITKGEWHSAIFFIVLQLFPRKLYWRIGGIWFDLVVNAFSISRSLRKNCIYHVFCQNCLQLHGINHHNFIPWKSFEFSHTFNRSGKWPEHEAVNLGYSKLWPKGQSRMKEQRTRQILRLCHTKRDWFWALWVRKVSGFWWLHLITGFLEVPSGHTTTLILNKIQSPLSQTGCEGLHRTS